MYPIIIAENSYTVEVMRGRFIVLEGPDGSGTTTHASALADRLRNQGQDVLLTQEPTEGPIGVFIRKQLAEGTLPASALQMLFSADRAWHVESVVLPALEQGKTVVSDRYMLSTLLYGQALGLSIDWLESMNKNFIQPDYQILALPSFETCMRRLNKRPTKDILESQDSLQKRVYELYKDAVMRYNLPVLDTDQSFEQVSARLLQLVDGVTN